jgi:hypothetical protein
VLSEQTPSTDSVAVVLQEENQSFLTDSLDLKKLLRDVSKHSKVAIDKLVDLLKCDDPRTQLAAAKTLLEMQVQLTKDMNTDKLQRMIAQLKLGGTRKLVAVSQDDDDEKDSRPVVDFATIKQM